MFKKVAQFTFAPSTEWDGTFTPEEQTSQQEPAGETTEVTGEKATFSPVYLTVNLQNPLKSGNITSRFGYRVSPVTGEYSLHTGLDIAASELPSKSLLKSPPHMTERYLEQIITVSAVTM